MLTYIAHAEGSVSSSIIIDATELSADPEEVVVFLKRLYADLELNESKHGLISKFVLLRRSSHPMYDLSYWFFQLIPGDPVTFDYKGSCGHSILAAIQVAMKWGWVPGASPGLRVRVYIENVGDSLVCEVDQASREQLNCTAHFIENPKVTLGSLLPTGQPSNRLSTSFGAFDVSIVSAGNPYVFVSAEALGLHTERELFEAGASTLAQLQEIRRAASFLLGWNPESVFPKICALGSFEPDAVSVRAISVPSWHPTIALTGAACVGAAASIHGSVVYEHIGRFPGSGGPLRLRTKGGTTAVSTATTGPFLDDYLLYNSISEKRVQLIGPLPLKRGAGLEWAPPRKVLA